MTAERCGGGASRPIDFNACSRALGAVRGMSPTGGVGSRPTSRVVEQPASTKVSATSDPRRASCDMRPPAFHLSPPHGAGIGAVRPREVYAVAGAGFESQNHAGFASGSRHPAATTSRVGNVEPRAAIASGSSRGSAARTPRTNLDGAVNVAAPAPLPQHEFARALREACGVRVGLPATAWMPEAARDLAARFPSGSLARATGAP
jgi:hypothetical protein